jgi:hypothetical protein
MLCDFAQEVGGKLYVLGGGFSRCYSWGQPVNMCLAIKLELPWHSANTKIKFAVSLVTEDGKPVPNPMGVPIAAEGQLEAGRPPGLAPGTALDAALAIPMFGLQLSHGGYRWELSVDDELIQWAPFQVVPPPPGFPIPQRAPG